MAGTSLRHPGRRAPAAMVGVAESRRRSTSGRPPSPAGGRRGPAAGKAGPADTGRVPQWGRRDCWGGRCRGARRGRPAWEGLRRRGRPDSAAPRATWVQSLLEVAWSCRRSGGVCAMGDPERPEVAGPEPEEVKAAAAFPQVRGLPGHWDAGGGGDLPGAGPL